MSVLIYGERLPTGQDPAALAREVVNEVQLMLQHRFPNYGFRVSPAAQRLGV